MADKLLSTSLSRYRFIQCLPDWIDFLMRALIEGHFVAEVLPEATAAKTRQVIAHLSETGTHNSICRLVVNKKFGSSITVCLPEIHPLPDLSTLFSNIYASIIQKSYLGFGLTNYERGVSVSASPEIYVYNPYMFAVCGWRRSPHFIVRPFLS